MLLVNEMSIMFDSRLDVQNTVYELNGTTHTSQWVLQQYKEASEQFRRDNPDSSGAKVILAAGRNKDRGYIHHAIDDVIRLRNQFPGFVLGFDLVRQEDIGHTNLFYLKELLNGRQDSLPYYFHSGETDWEGTIIDDNLVDAVLLNTSRIGHGFALSKHPELMKLVKERGIAIEVNPISNQVLGLVRDLRNHPMSFLMAQDFPVVISSDDNALLGSRPLSHDFYMAFMGMAGEDADLRLLKKLAWNSLRYSAMEPDEKASAIALWRKKWDLFIRAVTRLYSAQTNIVG